MSAVEATNGVRVDATSVTSLAAALGDATVTSEVTMAAPLSAETELLLPPLSFTARRVDFQLIPLHASGGVPLDYDAIDAALVDADQGGSDREDVAWTVQNIKLMRDAQVDDSEDYGSAPDTGDEEEEEEDMDAEEGMDDSSSCDESGCSSLSSDYSDGNLNADSFLEVEEILRPTLAKVGMISDIVNIVVEYADFDAFERIAQLHILCLRVLDASTVGWPPQENDVDSLSLECEDDLMPTGSSAVMVAAAATRRDSLTVDQMPRESRFTDALLKLRGIMGGSMSCGIVDLRKFRPRVQAALRWFELSCDAALPDIDVPLLQSPNLSSLSIDQWQKLHAHMPRSLLLALEAVLTEDLDYWDRINDQIEEQEAHDVESEEKLGYSIANMVDRVLSLPGSGFLQPNETRYFVEPIDAEEDEAGLHKPDTTSACPASSTTTSSSSPSTLSTPLTAAADAAADAAAADAAADAAAAAVPPRSIVTRARSPDCHPSFSERAWHGITDSKDELRNRVPDLQLSQSEYEGGSHGSAALNPLKSTSHKRKLDQAGSLNRHKRVKIGSDATCDSADELDEEDEMKVEEARTPQTGPNVEKTPSLARHQTVASALVKKRVAVLDVEASTIRYAHMCNRFAMTPMKHAAATALLEILRRAYNSEGPFGSWSRWDSFPDHRDNDSDDEFDSEPRMRVMNETVRTALANYYLMYVPRSPDTDRMFHHHSALENIRREQMQTDLTFSRPYFHKLVIDITRQFSDSLVWTSNALEALQTAAENWTTEMFEDAQLAAIHRRSWVRYDLDSHLLRWKTRQQRAEQYTRRAAQLAEKPSIATQSNSMDGMEDVPAASTNGASPAVNDTGVAAREDSSSSSSKILTDDLLASISAWEPELAAVVQGRDIALSFRLISKSAMNLSGTCPIERYAGVNIRWPYLPPASGSTIKQ